MNRGTKSLLGLLALAALILGFAGGFGFFATPDLTVVESSLDQETQEIVGEDSEPMQPEIIEAEPCNGQPGNPTTYYANDPSAAQYNNFGTPLDPALSPLDNPQDPEPDVHQIVDALWERFCDDPALTRAVVAAAFPTWDQLDEESFDWMSALKKLDTINWSEAELVYYTEPPTPWTMMMKSDESADNPPTTHITRANHAGWYLHLTVDGSDPLLLRVACGGQPSLDITEGTPQAVLTEFFSVR